MATSKLLAASVLSLMLTFSGPSLLKADTSYIKVCLINHADVGVQFNIVYKDSDYFGCSGYHWSDATRVPNKGKQNCNRIPYDGSCAQPSVYIYAVAGPHPTLVGHDIEYNSNDLNGDDTLTYAVYSDPSHCGNDKYCYKFVSHQLGG